MRRQRFYQVYGVLSLPSAQQADEGVMPERLLRKTLKDTAPSQQRTESRA